MHRCIRLFTALLSLCASCAPALDADVVAADVETWPPGAECGARFPGEPEPSVTEFEGDYEEELAALELTRFSPPFDLSSVGPTQKSVVNYMLQRIEGDSVTASDIDRAGQTGQAVHAAFAMGEGALDFSFLRKGLHYSYYCERPVPGSIDALVERYGDFRTWDQSSLDCAAPKNAPRRVFAEPQGRVLVSQTMVGDEVREHEVIFRDLRDDGQLDFAVYLATGELSDRSRFATLGGLVLLAAPYSCLSCHRDQSGAFSDVTPTGLGAGSMESSAMQASWLCLNSTPHTDTNCSFSPITSVTLAS